MQGRRRGQAAIWIIVFVAAIGSLGVAWQVMHSGGPEGPWHDDVDVAFAEAETVGKPVFILFTADWCPPCQQLKRDVFGDGYTMDWLANDFVLVKVDLSERGGPNSQVAGMYGVQGIPTMKIYDAEGYLKGTTAGGMGAMDFEHWVESLDM